MRKHEHWNIGHWARDDIIPINVMFSALASIYHIRTILIESKPPIRWMFNLSSHFDRRETQFQVFQTFKMIKCEIFFSMCPFDKCLWTISVDSMEGLWWTCVRVLSFVYFWCRRNKSTSVLLERGPVLAKFGLVDGTTNGRKSDRHTN